MNVHGFKVRPDIIAALEARMKEAPFCCSQLAARAEHHGVPRSIASKRFPYGQTGCAERVADRLIQKHRKLGNIALAKQEWRWVGAK